MLGYFGCRCIKSADQHRYAEFAASATIVLPSSWIQAKLNRSNSPQCVHKITIYILNVNQTRNPAYTQTKCCTRRPWWNSIYRLVYHNFQLNDTIFCTSICICLVVSLIWFVFHVCFCEINALKVPEIEIQAEWVWLGYREPSEQSKCTSNLCSSFFCCCWLICVYFRM